MDAPVSGTTGLDTLGRRREGRTRIPVVEGARVAAAMRARVAAAMRPRVAAAMRARVVAAMRARVVAAMRAERAVFGSERANEPDLDPVAFGWSGVQLLPP
jgi:hypothetical protein